MTTMVNNDLTNLKKELGYSLATLSGGKLNSDIAYRIADKSIDNIDLNNSILAHKGTNWYAKEILTSLKLI